jgi:hypothetical protein
MSPIVNKQLSVKWVSTFIASSSKIRRRQKLLLFLFNFSNFSSKKCSLIIFTLKSLHGCKTIFLLGISTDAKETYFLFAPDKRQKENKRCKLSPLWVTDAKRNVVSFLP